MNVCSCCLIEHQKLLSFMLRSGTIRSWSRSFYWDDRFRAVDERLKRIANIKRRKGKGRPADGITRYVASFVLWIFAYDLRLLVRCGSGRGRHWESRLVWAWLCRLEIEEFLRCYSCMPTIEMQQDRKGDYKDGNRGYWGNMSSHKNVRCGRSSRIITNAM